MLASIFLILRFILSLLGFNKLSELIKVNHRNLFQKVKY